MGNMRFENRTILITGGTSGMGRAVAYAFADEGASVIIIGRNADRATEVCRIINSKYPGRAEYFLCDVSYEDDVIKLSSAIDERYDRIDVLFNNAGVFITQSLDEISAESWHKTFGVNVDGAMYMTKYFIEKLSYSKGCIINNASVSGLQSFTSGKKNYMYGASKAALIKFSKLCALNYAGWVRVNAICPGIIDTEIFTNRDFSRFSGAIPMGYVAQPDAVTGLVLFLASNEAYYITGAVIPVDGGMSLL